MNSSGKNLKVLLLRLKGEMVEESIHPRAIRPPYTLKYAEALLKREGVFDVVAQDCLIREVSYATLIRKVNDFNPNIIGICHMSFDQDCLEKFIAAVRETIDPLFVLMGQGVLSDNIEQFAAINKNIIILKGEAEQTFSDLANDLRAGKSYLELTNKFDGSLNIVKEPERLPFPHYTVEETRRYFFLYPLRYNESLKWGHILSSRGCPHRCVFCSSVMRESYGHQVRLRSAENILDEIVYQKKLGINIFSFDDDDFTADKEHVFSVCKDLIHNKINLPWIVHARVDEVDEKMLRIMKKAGCILVRFGIESASKEVLSSLNKGNPYRWTDQSLEVFSIAKKIGLPTVALFCIGCPGETREDVESSISLAKELDSDMIQVSFFTPYPGSIIYSGLKSSLDPSLIRNMYHYSEPVINLSKIDIASLLQLHKRFYKEFIFRPVFLLKHLKRYLLFYFFNLHVAFTLLRSTCRIIKRRN